jgi:hypothetical protein
MVYNTQNYWGFGFNPSCGILKKHQKTQRFGNWFCFHSQVKGETPVLLGPLETASLSHWAQDRRTGF